MAPQGNDVDLLKEVVARILAVSEPERIILFGSYARGEARVMVDHLAGSEPRILRAG
jgi:predicted nucleotidyltransferase